MRIHTDHVTAHDLRSILAAEQDAGRISRVVYFDALSTHRSAVRERGLEIKLAATAKTPGRRFANHGSYGAADAYAATYDEWGWLLAALFALDPDAVAGSFKHPVYDGAVGFHERTGWSYNPVALLDALWPTFPDSDPYPFVNARVPEQVGRIGYGRISEDNAPPYFRRERDEAIASPGKRKGKWLHYMPRTAEQVRAFAHLDTVEV